MRPDGAAEVGILGEALAGGGLDEVAARYAELSRQAREHAAGARSASTTRAYDSDWRHFSTWCARYRQDPLPARAQTVANYLTDHAPRWRPATGEELERAKARRTRAGARVVDGQVRVGVLPATLRRRLAAIGVIHRAAGHDNPAAHQLVRDVLDGISRTPAAAGRRQAAAASASPLLAMLAAMDPDHDPRDARDAAILLLGMPGALRRSELAALRIGDVALDHREGLEITLVRSKSDQHRRGLVVSIPDQTATDPETTSTEPDTSAATDGGSVAGRSTPASREFDVVVSPRVALQRWLDWLRRRPDHASGPEGVDNENAMPLPPGAPLWRPISRRQGADPRARIGVRGLSDRAISEIVKARARDAGLDGRWSGHSLRRGFATDAYAGGADEVEIMRHGRWASATTMRGYLEEGTRFRATHPVHRLTFPSESNGRHENS